jgi:hypothetical protein
MPRPGWRLTSLWRPPLSNDTREMIHDRLSEELAAGFDSPEQIAEDIVLGLDKHDDPAAVRKEIARTLPPLLAARRREQASWPATTDCDRLDAAFEELNSMGIMARHHWQCCQNCGHSVMPDEFERLQGSWSGVPITGYVFYHIQDTESAVAGHGMCFAFGAIGPADDGSDEATLRIARAARDILEQFGLAVEWNGAINRRPRVRLIWQRRKPPDRFTERWAEA